MKFKNLLYKFCFFCLILMPSSGYAQDTCKIQVLHKTTENGVILRWAPDDPVCWFYANTYGYTIERYTFVDKGVSVDSIYHTKRLLTTHAIKPAPLDEWEPYAEQDKYVAIAAEAIYGENFVPEIQGNDLSQIKNKATELHNKYSFALFCADQSLTAAKLMGLHFADTTIQDSSRYLYRIYCLTPDSIQPADTGAVFIDTRDISSLPKPFDLRAAPQGKNVLLTWNRRYFDAFYSSYQIERSDDSAKTFYPVNKNPFINPVKDLKKAPDYFMYMDSLPQYGKHYAYRVKGKSFFADYGPPSDTVWIKIKKKYKLNPELTKTMVLNNEDIYIRWEVPDSLKQHIIGYKIKLKQDALQDFRDMDITVLPDTLNEYRFKAPYLTNYLRVAALDKDSNEYLSNLKIAHLSDSIPPLPPTGLTGIIDTTGKAIIKWNPNAELDLDGYRIYCANNPTDEFFQVTSAPVQDTIYTMDVSLQTLTRFFYVKAVATDIRFNRSGFSEVLKLTRPDTISPPSPFFTSLEKTDTCVFLNWTKSSGNDVTEHVIYRKITGKENWFKLKSIDSAGISNEFVDCGLLPGNLYDYHIVAIDSSGNVSKPSESFRASLIDKKIRQSMDNITAKPDRRKKNITLEWDYPFAGIKDIYIYRGDKKAKIRLHDVVPGNKDFYTDEDITINTRYVYRLQANYETGESSKLSREVIVEY